MSHRSSIDQMDQEALFPFPPKRIVSLVPSQTEFLLDIGAPLVGRTKFCIHPAEKVQNIPIIGGTKNFRMKEIHTLNPDLIIGNKEENHEQGILKLKQDFPVWMSDISTLDHAFDMMLRIGQLCDRGGAAQIIIEKSREATEQVRGSKSGRVLYLIWQNPWMAAGKTTFIDHLLTHLGYENVVTQARYPKLTTQEIAEMDPEKILFSSEPFPFKNKHIAEAKSLWSKAKTYLVDGELFSWYGSRLSHWK